MNLGDFSRGGKSRAAQAVKAMDHDRANKQKMIPFGLLNLTDDDLHVTYGCSYKTSDFICDAIEQWWASVKTRYQAINERVIYSDNGPESNSHRTQFLFRLVAFSKVTGLKIHLVYYPPYHSKYNPIERCWAFLEKHWNGTLLGTANTKTMTWRATKPVVHILCEEYAKGVRPIQSEVDAMQSFIKRHQNLPKWDVLITPSMGCY